MNNGIFSQIDLKSYDLSGEDFVFAAFLMSYLTTLSQEEAQRILAAVFPSERKEESDDDVVNITALTDFIKEVQEKTRKKYEDGNKDKDDWFSQEMMGIIRSVTSDDFNATKYVLNAPFGIFDMLHDCYMSLNTRA